MIISMKKTSDKAQKKAAHFCTALFTFDYVWGILA